MFEAGGCSRIKILLSCYVGGLFLSSLPIYGRDSVFQPGEGKLTQIPLLKKIVLVFNICDRTFVFF